MFAWPLLFWRFTIPAWEKPDKFLARVCFEKKAGNPKKTDRPISRPSFLLCEIRRMAPILFFPFYPSCSVCCCAVNTVILMHRPQLSAPAAAIPLILPPHKCFQSICLNECKVFQHAHVVYFVRYRLSSAFSLLHGYTAHSKQKAFLPAHFWMEQFRQAFLSPPWPHPLQASPLP